MNTGQSNSNQRAETTGVPVDATDVRRAQTSWQGLHGFSAAGISVKTLRNPEGLLNNCAFVTIARLLDTDARTLCDYVGIRPQPGEPGVSLETIIEVLTSLGFIFSTRNSERALRTGIIHADRSGGRPFKAKPGSSNFGPPTGPTPRIGVVYTRPDGSGHVVVLEKPGTPYRHYRDHQVCRNTVDVNTDVQRGKIMMVFDVRRK